MLQFSTEELMKEVENSIAEFKRHKQEYDEERVKEQVCTFLLKNYGMLLLFPIFYSPFWVIYPLVSQTQFYYHTEETNPTHIIGFYKSTLSKSYLPKVISKTTSSLIYLWICC